MGRVIAFGAIDEPSSALGRVGGVVLQGWIVALENGGVVVGIFVDDVALGCPDQEDVPDASGHEDEVVDLQRLGHQAEGDIRQVGSEQEILLVGNERHRSPIAEALTLGGEKLAVDGVLLIGEHGTYPTNMKGQKL